MKKLFFIPLLGLLFPIFLWAQTSVEANDLLRFKGQEASDFTGYSVASAGDFDGDGYEDVLIGAPYYGSNNTGAAYLICGDSSPLESITLSDANFIFEGEEANDYAGWSVSSAGDVNNDGYDEILIGAPYAGIGDNGAAYLVFGGQGCSGTSTINLTNANVKFTGEQISDLAGYQVAGGGDFNNDGLADMLIGAPKNGVGNNGAAYLLVGVADYANDSITLNLSKANIKYIGVGNSDEAGTSVAFAGDVNGDGYADLLIGAPYLDGLNKINNAASNIGASYLLYGSQYIDGSYYLNVVANATYIGEEANDNAGYSVASAGDFNGDGYSDILIGAKGFGTGDYGKAYLINGGASMSAMNLVNADIEINNDTSNIGDTAGRTVASAGDIDNDGYSDILIATNDYSNNNTGAVYLFKGHNIVIDELQLSAANKKYTGTSANDYMGLSLGSGDFNGDGDSDILMGAPYKDLTSRTGTKTDTGIAYLDYTGYNESGIDRVTGAVNGNVKVTNQDGSEDTVNVWNIKTKKKTKIKLYDNGYYVVIHPFIRKIALINKGLILDRAKLFGKKRPSKNKFIKFINYKKKPIIVVVSNKKSYQQLYLIKLNTNKEKFGNKIKVVSDKQYKLKRLKLNKLKQLVGTKKFKKKFN